jgi:hypothetical protein
MGQNRFGWVSGKYRIFTVSEKEPPLLGERIWKETAEFDCIGNFSFGVIVNSPRPRTIPESSGAGQGRTMKKDAWADVLSSAPAAWAGGKKENGKD